MGYRAYRLESVEDLTKPFVSMYFGAAFVGWLTDFDGMYVTLTATKAYYFLSVNIFHFHNGWCLGEYELPKNTLTTFEQIRLFNFLNLKSRTKCKNSQKSDS